jgi:hypothetical protein
MGEFKSKEVTVDHIRPCGSLRGFQDLPDFVENLLCELDGLQMLCKPCHHTKTMYERGMSDDDIKVAKFKKLSAKEQRELVEGKNLAERLENYRRTL